MFGSGRSYHVEKWANKFTEDGYNVILVTLHKPEREFNSKIEIFAYTRRFQYLLALIKLWSLIKKYQLKSVQFHSAGFYGLASMFTWGKIQKILLVYGSDVFIVPEKSFMHRVVVSWIIRSCSIVISASHAMKKRVVSIAKINTDRVAVIPFGIDLKVFSLTSERDFACVKTIGIVKKLESVYGIDILIKAFHVLSKQHGDISLVIIGDGSQKSDLEELCVRLGIRKNVKFQSAVPNHAVPEKLAEIDIFVVPSKSESFGVAAVEAMAMELPVIASNVGGLPEVTDYGRCGILCTPSEVDELAQKMSELINDKNIRVKLSQLARAHVAEIYDLEKNYTSFRALINE